MDLETKRLIETGTIFCGRIIKEDGVVSFERVDPAQIENIPEAERGFATASMGRAVFTIDGAGTIHTFKGVDSHLSTSELGMMKLANAKSIEYIPNEQGYKISAIVYHNREPEIRINGTSPLEDVEIEGDINMKLAGMGVKVPTIRYIREIPQGFCFKHGLPIKVPGSLDDLKSDYAAEDDRRKRRLRYIYGLDYTEDIEPGQRPETMREYLSRIGFLSDPWVQLNIDSLGFSLPEFIDSVDKSYSRGQRYGQTERVMRTPFRISDLEICIANGNKEQLKAIMDFSEKMINSNFTTQLAETFGKNIATLMNNGWECENLLHKQDFSLTGEFCDDAYFDITAKQNELNEKYKNAPYIVNAEMGEIKRKYTGQVMNIAGCIKIVQEAMRITGKSPKEIDGVLETFTDSFTKNLDLQKIGEIFSIDKKQALENLKNEFRPGQNWTEKISSQERKEGMIMDARMYSVHAGNEAFYEHVSDMIEENISERRFSKEKGLSTKNKILEFIKNFMSKLKGQPEEETLMLPEAEEGREPINYKQQRSEFLDSIKVTSKDLVKTEQKQLTNVPQQGQIKENSGREDI